MSKGCYKLDIDETERGSLIISQSPLVVEAQHIMRACNKTDRFVAKPRAPSDPCIEILTFYLPLRLARLLTIRVIQSVAIR